MSQEVIRNPSILSSDSHYHSLPDYCTQNINAEAKLETNLAKLDSLENGSNIPTRRLEKGSNNPQKRRAKIIPKYSHNKRNITSKK